MKIAPLLVASVSALETSTSASALLAAVGKRNVTHMEALVQGLAEESIKEPAWKFDQDIKDALEAINNMFVKSIQQALIEQHKADQVAHNCVTKECFDSCKAGYDEGHKNCRAKIEVCEVTMADHEQCRFDVYDLYKDMAKKCSALHCFYPPPIDCQTEECICPDVLNCHYGVKDSYGNVECKAKQGECLSDSKKGYGAWLSSVIQSYTLAHEEWVNLRDECTWAYRKFLHADVECDGIQKKFEICMCEQEVDEERICSNDFSQCNQQCRLIYDRDVPNLQCQEKDRKIDWSATKKIECYLDVLLHDYTKQELLDDCGSEDCINVAREKAYKHCGTICPKVDHDGHWGQPTCDDEGNVKLSDHPHRKMHDQYHLGDLEVYECDENGHEVHTNHRGGAKRVEEGRCTEHLDIDYQIPPWRKCIDKPGTVCDADFHCKYYAKFDNTQKIGCISDCCPENGGGCFPNTKLTSCNGDGGAYGSDWTSSLTFISFGEHTHAWAYNRCECTTCYAVLPVYPIPDDPTQGKCTGVHTPGFGKRWEDAYGGIEEQPVLGR